MMASASSCVIPSEGLLKFRLYYFVRTWGKKVVFRIFSCCFLESSLKTIREILEENGISFGRRSPFTIQQIDTISNDPPESLDITAIDRICQVLWGKGVNYPNDRVKDLMKLIKDERNSVSHGECNVSQSELAVKLQEFGRTLEEALDEAVVLYPCHGAEFNQLKIDIGETIAKIQEKIREKYDPSNPDDCKRLQAEIEEFGDQLRAFIQEKSIKEVLPFYRDLCRVLPFDWLCRYGIIDPCNIMVSLQMNTHNEFHGSHSKHDTITLDQNEILGIKDVNGDDPKVVIISGNAGAGKTMLLSSMVEKWLKKETDDFPSLSAYQMLLYMEFRKHDYDKFDDYLRDLLQHVVVDFNFELVKSSIIRLRCLILCDGYDEKNDSSSKLFNEILGLKCSYMKVVVTTRPGNTEELTRVVNKSKKQKINLSVLGLREEERRRLIERLTHYLIRDETERDEMISEIDGIFKTMTPEIKEILKNPLQFNLFVLLYIEYPDLRGTINSVTKLFLELQKHYARRLMEKLEIDNDEIVSAYENTQKRWSLRYYLQKTYELTEEDISVFKQKCAVLSLSSDSIMSTYFNIKHTCKGHEVNKIYCYRHRTEQEFAAAGAICDVIEKLYEDNRSLFLELKENGMNMIKLALGYSRCEKELPFFSIDSEGRKEGLLGFFNLIDVNEMNTGIDVTEQVKPIMRFVTGILYNTDDKDMLYLVIDNILDMIVEEPYEEPDEDTSYCIDPLLLLLRETNNDSKVSDAIARKIKNTLDQSKPTLLLRDRQNIPCVLSLLSSMQCAALHLHLHYDYDLNDIPDLITVIEFTVRNDIELHLWLPLVSRTNIYGYSDKYLDIAVNCVEFHGRLTENGINLIPTCIKDLALTVDLQPDIRTLHSLSRHLPSLTQLKSLDIILGDDGSAVLDCLSPLQYSGDHFGVTLYYKGKEPDEHTRVTRFAKLLNAIWPKELDESADTSLWINSSMTHTGASLERLLESLLPLLPLNYIVITNLTEDARERQDELQTLYQSKGLHNLFLS